MNTFDQLNNKLINHYHYFNTKQFFLNIINKQKKYINITTSSTKNTCPITLYKKITKFIKKNLPYPKNFHFIHVGAWVFEIKKL